jgi:hypothetical protein
MAVALGQCGGQSVPLAQHLLQRKMGRDGVLNLMERKSELAPFTALPRLRRERSPRGKVRARFG